MGNFDEWTDRWGSGDRQWLQTRAKENMEEDRQWLRNCEMEIPTREMMMSTVNVEGMRACETGRDRWRN